MLSTTLTAGELVATFRAERGMICVSLRHRGDEVLRGIDALDIAAAEGRVAGIPLLHPWANRLSKTHFSVAGRQMSLERTSPLLHWDVNGLPIHGVPWSRLHWTVLDSSDQSLRAALDWSGDLLSAFPFAHRIELDVRLDAAGVEIETCLLANTDAPVPVSFGFHPYLGIPGVAREQWHLTLPAMQHVELDPVLLPTGRRLPFACLDQSLGDLEFDDGFALPSEDWSMSIAGGGRRVTMRALHGYRYSQVYARRDLQLIALEPMTAPTDALVSGEGLRVLAPGERYTAAFRIDVQSI